AKSHPGSWRTWIRFAQFGRVAGGAAVRHLRLAIDPHNRRQQSCRVGKIVRGTVAAWAIRAFTPVFDGPSGRLRPSSTGYGRVHDLPTRAIEQRAFAHPTRLSCLDCDYPVGGPIPLLVAGIRDRGVWHRASRVRASPTRVNAGMTTNLTPSAHAHAGGRWDRSMARRVSRC